MASAVSTKSARIGASNTNTAMASTDSNRAAARSTTRYSSGPKPRLRRS